MAKSIQYLLFGLLAVAGLGFIWAIGTAGYYTLWVQDAPQPARMPAFLAEWVVAIGAALGTNLGAALGLKTTQGTWLRPGQPGTGEMLRITAAWFYILALLGALVLWGIAGFTDDPNAVVATLPQLARSLLGVLAGAVAVVLGTKQ